MSSFESDKEIICKMLELNGYGVRAGKMAGDDFRMFLTPPGFEVESEEIFKLKENDAVCCGSEIMMGGEIQDVFFKQSPDDRKKFRKQIKNAPGVEDLDYFEIIEDGKDFRITIRSEFSIYDLSEDVFADAMDRLNLAGGSIEDIYNEYFEKLMKD